MMMMSHKLQQQPYGRLYLSRYSVRQLQEHTCTCGEKLTAEGVFVANLDGSLIIASSQQIASEFNALSSASWLVTSFVLALCASQPLVSVAQSHSATNLY